MAHPTDSPVHEPFTHSTKQHFVYLKLRTAIIDCDLQPSERLLIDELARRYDVSIIPVREALRVLQSEGLVVNVPHVGTAVAPIEADSITEALTIMEGLEIVSTRIATERATDPDLDDLESLVTAMDGALASQETERWALLNRQFHVEIAGLAAMPLLRDMLIRAFDRWERAWHYYFRGVLTRRVSQAQAEHREILQQLRARDVAALEGTVRQHNRRALEAYTAELAALQEGR